jgi:hypothetical protein
MRAPQKLLIGFILAMCALSVAPASALGRIDLKYIYLSGDPAFSCRSEPATSYVAIRSLEQWSKYCDPRNPSLAASQKAIDFDHYTLLVAHAGARPNLSYMLLFSAVYEQANDVSVTVLEVTPGNCPRLESLMNLRAYALIPKTSKPVQFEISQATHDCDTQKIVN